VGERRRIHQAGRKAEREERMTRRWSEEWSVESQSTLLLNANDWWWHVGRYEERASRRWTRRLSYGSGRAAE
jgi:protein-disulfide isomerase-like protein with CxxC motif